MAVSPSGGAHAQEGKPTLKIVVPDAAGGATDALARLLAPRLSRELAQNVVVENRAGASGQIGTAAVKSAAPDGNTFLLSIDRKAGIQLQPVPFSGSAAVMPQLIGGQIAAGVTGEAQGVAMARGGKLRILAVSGTSRSALLPDVPTFEELGFSGVNVNSFTAFFASKGLPRPMAERFNAALRKVLADDAVKARMADMPMHLAPTDLEGARRELTASYAFWNDPKRSGP
jgi:tripartite-type tricarboxylate transporter receptor subunit TctC